jgi:hypothetical protein
MTTAGPDLPLTAADLLFGSSADAPKALTREIMSARHAENVGNALKHLPRVTREAAAKEAAAAAAGLLKVDLIDVLVAGWREHREIIAAARRTLATPGSKELVGLAAHRITTVQEPAVSILLDGRRVHTLKLGVSIFFDVTGLVAGVHVGRLAGIHAGRCDLGVALTIHDVEVLTKRAHLELPGVRALKSGVRLLPAREYPDGEHTGSELAGSVHTGTQFPESQFPAVELAAAGHLSGGDPGGAHHSSQSQGGAYHSSQFPGGEHPSTEHPSTEYPSTEYPSTEYPSTEYPSTELSGSEHPDSGPPDVVDHPSSPVSGSWWERAEAPQTQPTRPS